MHIQGLAMRCTYLKRILEGLKQGTQRSHNNGDVASWRVWWDIPLRIIKDSMNHSFLKGVKRKGKIRV